MPCPSKIKSFIFSLFQATNGAGLRSYTVSLPLVIDSSPPPVGHVLETSPVYEVRITVEKTPLNIDETQDFVRILFLIYNAYLS